MPILGHLEKGTCPTEIVVREPGLTGHVLSERLRSMLRYRIIARYPHPSPSSVIEYRLTPLGRKVWEMLKTIEELDQKYTHGISETKPLSQNGTEQCSVIRLKPGANDMSEATG